MSALPGLQDIRRLAAEGALDQALGAIQGLVDRIFCEPLAVATVFGSPELDACCQAIGAATLARAGGQREAGGPPGPHVYIASRLQASGGHTAALEDVIRLSPAADSLVLVTGTCGTSDRAEVAARLARMPGVKLEFVPRGSRLAKLHWLQRRLLQLRPAMTWLFNHHQDSVAVAAVQPSLTGRLRYYHHGDHHLCLGVHLAHAEHFDPHPMGFHNCRELGLRANRYLPLTVQDLGPSPAGTAPARPLVTCTAGGANKLEVPYFVQYADLLPRILAVTGGRHVHIGRLTKLALARIRRGLEREGVPAQAFTCLPYVPSVWRALQEHAVDLYIASFPYGGGRTLIEVMGAGVPAVVHSHVRSRMLGGFDMAYPAAFVWRMPHELLSHLRDIDRGGLRDEGRQARAWYEAYHREEVARGLLAGGSQDPPVPALRPGFEPDALLQAWQTTRDVSVRGVLYRAALRAYRRTRSRLGLWA